jgi:alpha-tubulin suppressor-like RCC1 family protein/mRNA-degrading endonuclease RelE of RelBE toxin-antitoxin system
MEFRIADTFTDSLARLTGDEQKSVKTTVFDLQLNPAAPGLSFHKLDRARDKNFWSVRVNDDIRVIVHRSESSLLLCYVAHHDKAYDWAERRKLETHPNTGAAQLVEIRETVKEIVVPRYVDPSTPAPTPTPYVIPKPLFASVSDDVLLGYGVPREWLKDAKAATEETLLALAEHLPGEAAEALLELATGGKPRALQPVTTGNPFDHPDAQRRFRVMANADELARALEFPWDKWTIFLHPEQRQLVERDYAGPARVAGSAGTGKTIVALHRAAHLARANPDGRVLLTTFSDSLANALQTRLRRLLASEPRLGERIDVCSLDAVGARLYKTHVAAPVLATEKAVRDALRTAAAAVPGHKFAIPFLTGEWEAIVDAGQITTWEGYRDVARLGRKTRLPEQQRKVLWSIFENARATLKASGAITHAEMFTRLAEILASRSNVPYDFAVVDEAQDISLPQLKFLAAMGGNRPNALFFAGDLGQRIFQQPFSWKSAGVDVRGRSRTLRVNYRTSHQIRTQADRLLGEAVVDVDGESSNRNDTVSVFNGPAPRVQTFASQADEIRGVGEWIALRVKEGIAAHEFGVFVRAPAQLDRARAAVEAAGVPFKVLDDHVETAHGMVSISTMHIAKGLEFRAVAVMACDDEVLPLQERITNIGDRGDLPEVLETERHLLYVACTRARDHLLVSAVKPASEFLTDFGCRLNRFFERHFFHGSSDRHGVARRICRGNSAAVNRRAHCTTHRMPFASHSAPLFRALVFTALVASGCYRTVVPEFPDATAVDVRLVTNIEQLSASTWHTCARRSDGTVACWGSNSHGELGDGTNVERDTPTTVVGLDDAIDIACGEQFTCAVRRTGEVACWGSNQLRQLGHGEIRVDSSVPVPVDGVHDAVDVTAGEIHACARRRSGPVVCWNAEPWFPAGTENLTRISAGFTHFCGVEASGRVLCWGSNLGGELGNGTMEASRDAVSVIGVSDAVDVSGGFDYSCAVRRGGSVVCWGDGYLGDGEPTTRVAPGPEVIGLDDATRVAAELDTTCAMRRTGTVACWGRGWNGRLGDGTTIDERCTPGPVAALTDVVEIVGGHAHACARRANGEVWCWGDARSGELGSRIDAGAQSSPVRVSGL